MNFALKTLAALTITTSTLQASIGKSELTALSTKGLREQSINSFGFVKDINREIEKLVQDQTDLKQKIHLFKNKELNLHPLVLEYADKIIKEYPEVEQICKKNSDLQYVVRNFVLSVIATEVSIGSPNVSLKQTVSQAAYANFIALNGVNCIENYNRRMTARGLLAYLHKDLRHRFKLYPSSVDKISAVDRKGYYQISKTLQDIILVVNSETSGAYRVGFADGRKETAELMFGASLIAYLLYQARKKS